MWTVFLLLAITALASSGVFALINGISRYKSNRMLTPTKILSIGVGISAVLLYAPIFWNSYQGYRLGVIESFVETVLISFNAMIKLFVADGDFENVMTALLDESQSVYLGYRIMMSILFVMAPLMTFGFVLSFFKNLSARLRFATSLKKEVVVFSELNERSLILARNLSEKSGRLLVFTDVFERDEEHTYELLEKAKELGAIFFKKDITMINLEKRKKNAEMRLFIIGQDKTENISQSIKLIEKLKYRQHTHMYVLSTREEDELLLVNALKNGGVPSDGKRPEIRVRRINEVTSLIFHSLYEKGYESIFKSARAVDDCTKEIHAVVIGMGLHGTEMVKALSWFGQMNGYELHVHAFDVDPRAEDRFCSLCPELMDEAFNNHFDIEGEARYEIKIHAGFDVTTKTFDDELMSLPDATFVFVAMGEDDRNLNAAMKLRMLYKRRGAEPVIQTVIYHTEKKNILGGIKNYKNQEYNIDFVGDMKTTFSEKVIMNSDLEDKALARHTRWGNTQDDIDAFWQYSYNYKSSIASAIHYEMKVSCKIPGALQKPADRDPADRVALRVLEHCRWNAYMRSEGYVYSGSIDPSTRNDLAKKHHCLVPFSQLPLKEQEKDDD